MTTKMRVLQVIPTLSVGGISSVVKNWQQAVFSTNIQFDYLAFNDGILKSTFEAAGCHVDVIPTFRQRPLHYIIVIYKLLKQRQYDAVHVHNSFKNVVLLILARFLDVPVRVCHSHTSGLENKRLQLIFLGLRWLTKRMSTHYVACGKAAGEFLFGEDQFTLLNNAIIVEQFSQQTDLTTTDFILPENKKLFLHVGRFSQVKNHAFILEIAQQQQLNSSICFLLVGDGPLKAMVEDKVKVLGLKENVKVFSSSNQIPQLLQQVDGFILPSLFEGVSVALLEAQAASLPCLVSDSVSKECDVGLGLVSFLSLNHMNDWVEALNHVSSPKLNVEHISEAFDESGFSNSQNINKLMRIYRGL
ncbi:glycosyltransferase [Thalassotalea sp. 1_MG-2023]|uniref:glycosyltransferase n=1 Tax=Thalassotalea sp. 1_MG-2023 TaxID=3062680 RepID=UPI0026E2E070|nr:glycosyltransferase [Thalassotalea sp. 1_MG-2023]MDO6425533.1 glycosyltransferase [Thalassotalea sp. 1_MG-2023]